MHIEYVRYGLVILLGLMLAWALLHSRWPGWKGFPLLSMVLLATIDLGIAPLLFGLSGVQYRAEKLTTRAYGSEALRSCALILIGYLSILGGLILIRLLPYKPIKSECLSSIHRSHQGMAQRSWRVSLFIFVLGVVVNAIIIGSLLRSQDLLTIASQRALFTDEGLEFLPAYTLRVLRSLMLVGALGMVTFSAGGRARLRMAVGGGLSSVGVAALYGGRGGVITDMLCLLLVYRYAVGPIPLRRMMCYLLTFTIILGGLLYSRFGFLFAEGASNIDVLRVLRYTVISYCRVDKAAWVLRTVPDVIPHTGVLNAGAAMGRFAPGFQVPGAVSLYEQVVEKFYSGVNPMGGIGGATYGTAAELYAWGGWLSVIAFGSLMGMFFGAIFEWERRSRNNPFLLMAVVVIAIKVFLGGLQGGLSNVMWQAGIYLVLVGAMAALSTSSRRIIPFLLLLWWDLLMMMFWKASDIDAFRYFIVGSMPLVYLWAVASVRVAGACLRGDISPWDGGHWLSGESNTIESYTRTNTAANAI